VFAPARQGGGGGVPLSSAAACSEVDRSALGGPGQAREGLGGSCCVTNVYF
jgi:hypothetical protein